MIESDSMARHLLHLRALHHRAYSPIYRDYRYHYECVVSGFPRESQRNRAGLCLHRSFPGGCRGVVCDVQGPTIATNVYAWSVKHEYAWPLDFGFIFYVGVWRGCEVASGRAAAGADAGGVLAG